MKEFESWGSCIRPLSLCWVLGARGADAAAVWFPLRPQCQAPRLAQGKGLSTHLWHKRCTMKFDLCLCPECLSHLWAQTCQSCLHGGTRSLPPGSPAPPTGSHWRAGLGLIHIRGPQEALEDVHSVKAWLLSVCSLASLLLGNSRARRVPCEQGPVR